MVIGVSATSGAVTGGTPGNFGGQNLQNNLPISSGQSDVVLSSGGGKKNSKIWMIVSIILVLLGVGVGVVAVVMLNGQKEQNNTAITGEVKKKFNSYANYILTGENSDDDIDISSIYNSDYYADGVLFNQENLSENIKIKADFLNNLEEKYNALIKVYDGPYDLSDIQVYFYDFAKLKTLNESEIFDNYISLGAQATQELIKSNLKIQGIEYNKNLLNFLQAENKLELALVDYYNELNNAGCIMNGVLNDECADLNIETGEIVMAAGEGVFRAENSLSNGARTTLENVYGEIYDIDETGGNV